MTNLYLLKLFGTRSVYQKYIKFINLELLGLEAKLIFESYEKYFEQFNHEIIDWDQFPTWFHHYCYPDLPKSKLEIFNGLFEKLKGIEIDVVEKILPKYQQFETKQLIVEHLDNDFDLEYLYQLLDTHKARTTLFTEQDDPAVIENDLERIINSTKKQEGLMWNLDILNTSIGPLNKGAFIVIAAYVDVGKTTLAISEATYMARQLEEGCVLYLNNEEFNDRMLKKIWQSTLGISEEKLISYKEKAKEEYIKRMHGDINRIKFVDITDKTLSEISLLFEKYKPKLAVIDQIDNIYEKGKKSFSERDRLKKVYTEVRNLSKLYCPVIAITQASGDVTYEDKETHEIKYSLFPHFKQLAESKVGKQGTLDACIMIGKHNNYPNIRGISVTKNKFGDTAQQEVAFNGEIVRYENIQ